MKIIMRVKFVRSTVVSNENVGKCEDEFGCLFYIGGGKGGRGAVAPPLFSGFYIAGPPLSYKTNGLAPHSSA